MKHERGEISLSIFCGGASINYSRGQTLEGEDYLINETGVQKLNMEMGFWNFGNVLWLFLLASKIGSKDIKIKKEEKSLGAQLDILPLVL